MFNIFKKKINDNIFREYDVRGVYPKEMNENFSFIFGKAFGSYVKSLNQDICIVGRDNRYSSLSIKESLIKGIISTGCNVIDLGLVTTPMFYCARILKNIKSGIMITASHNPKDDNGFKFGFTGENAKGQEIYDFRDYLKKNKFIKGKGIVSNYNIKKEYITLLKNSIMPLSKKLKVVVDPGNGTTSLFIKQILKEFNIEPIYICDESDSSFPFHHPDPCVEENLTMLKEAVIKNKADLGVSYDGDGDRCGVVDKYGNMIKTDTYMAIMIHDILKSDNNKTILYDVKCSKALEDEIKKLKGIPYCYRTGASYTMSETINKNIPFGGELSGHVYFNDRMKAIGSGIYASLRLIELLSNKDKTLEEYVNDLNKYYSTEELKFKSTDEDKNKVVEQIKEYCLSKNYKLLLIDGVKVLFKDGWALIRVSNTGPNITARFEATTKKRLDELSEEFISKINEYNTYNN